MKVHCVRLFLTLIFSLGFSLWAVGEDKRLNDTVRIVGDVYYTPYQMLNDEGEPEGMVVDLMKEVMRRMKMPYTIKLMTKHEMLEAFNDHHSRVIAMGLICAGDRDKTIKYGLAYRYVFENMICRKKESHQYNTVTDMRGKRIMVEDGSYSERLLRNMGFSKELIPVANLKKAFIALSKNKCDVVFCPGEMAFYVIEELEMTDKLERKDASLDPLKYGMAGNDSLLLDRIKTTVLGMKGDGTYDQIYNKWFYDADRSRQYLRVLNYIGTIAVLLVAFVFILRSKVKSARKELAEKNLKLMEKEKYLSELLQRYMVLFNNTTVGTHVYDGEGYLLAANKASCDILGVKDCEQMIDSQVNIFDNPVLKPHLDQYHPESSIFIEDIDFVKLSKIKYFKDCTRRGHAYLELRMTPVFDNEHNLSAIILNLTDVTKNQNLVVALQNYADKMKFIFSSSGVETWEFFPETETCSWDSIKGHIDMESKDMVLIMADQNDRKQIEDIFAQMKERTVDKFSLTVKVNGQNAYRSVEGTAVRNEEGEIMHYSGVSHDITDLISIQNRLEEEKEKAQRADKLKSAFLTNMSHEIRTPLNSIIGFSQMLPTIEDEITRQKVIDVIMTNNDLLLHLINNILDLSKIEAGVVEINETDIDISECIQNLSHSFFYEAKQDAPNLILDLSERNFIIKSDKKLLTQILYNLLNNAYKFTKRGYIKISFNPEDDGVYISVEDTGIGIQQERFDMIFNSFEQIDGFTQGVGLGLSICKANVKLLKGKIGLRSTFGIGSTFWIWLPLK